MPSPLSHCPQRCSQATPPGAAPGLFFALPGFLVACRHSQTTVLRCISRRAGRHSEHTPPGVVRGKTPAGAPPFHNPPEKERRCAALSSLSRSSVPIGPLSLAIRRPLPSFPRPEEERGLPFVRPVGRTQQPAIPRTAGSRPPEELPLRSHGSARNGCELGGREEGDRPRRSCVPLSAAAWHPTAERTRKILRLLARQRWPGGRPSAAAVASNRGVVWSASRFP